MFCVSFLILLSVFCFCLMSVVIQVDRLSKQYRLGTIGGKRLVDDVNRWWAKLRGHEDPLSKIGDGRRKIGAAAAAPAPSPSPNSHLPSSPSDTLWALKDVSFEVKQGEVLGIIGRNGAGKSTLLKVLSRVTGPSSGEVRVKGRIASLLEVGTGFHPELTGRENIFLNGAILGMTKAEITKKFDEIVVFSEVERFIDTPVKRYSSGMHVRLAFAVAAHLEPEILIVDEVLAVGDAAFQRKCLGKMHDVAGQGRTVLFVSHNMAAVQNLCESVIVLAKGNLIFQGHPTSAVQNYLEPVGGNLASSWSRPPNHPDSPLEIRSVSVSLKGEQPQHSLHLEVSCVSRAQHKPCFVVSEVLDVDGAVIMQIIPTEHAFLTSQRASHCFRIEAHLPPLIPGRYTVSVWVGSNHDTTFDRATLCASFDVTSYPDLNRTFPYYRNHGSIIAPSKLCYPTSTPQAL
jgi:lipopolysaccharide transport system ATP-binding protein